MKKRLRIILCISLSLAMLLPAGTPACAAVEAEEGCPLAVVISYDKTSYSSTATATVDVLLTNTGSEALWSVKAENLLPDTLTAYGKAPLSASAEKLAPGETIKISFEACLNPDSANVNFFAKIILTFKAFFKGIGGMKKITNEETIDINDTAHEYFDTSKNITFGKITAQHTVRAAYSKVLIPPIGGTMAQIAGFYNRFANAAKAYSGTVKVAKKSGTVSVVNYVAGGILYRTLLENTLPNDFGFKPTLTFVNGQCGSTSLVGYLPREGEQKASNLEPEGIKSATCVKEGSGFKVSITLKAEVLGELTAVPLYHAQCMDSVLISAAEFEPFTLGTATVTYTDRSSITAYFDGQGLLMSLNLVEPVQITGDVYYNSILLSRTDFTCTFKQEFTLTYLA